MAKARSKCAYMQNRELSWLKFNERVMDEATDESVPLLERLRFLTIFTTNLDEFFQVRVGSLIDMLPLGDKAVDNKTGMTAREQLDAIYSAVRPLYEKRNRIFTELEHKMRDEGISRLTYSELGPEDQDYIESYFLSNILPTLSPQIVDAHHPFPHLQNKVIEISVLLRNDKGKELFAILPLPSVLPDVVYLPGSDIRYIATEDILYEFTDVVFDTYTLVEKVCICITRNADIHAEDEDVEVTDDFRNVMKRMVKDRKRLAPLRLELTNGICMRSFEFLKSKLHLSDAQIYYTSAPLKLDYAYPLADKLSAAQKEKLLYPPYRPCIPDTVDPHRSMFEQIREHDILLSYPYESMDPFLDFLREAADDPAVIAIQITIYRLARESRVVEYLCRAAEKGKDVLTLIELRARFDEQNNIDWSEALEKAGCTVIYGVPGYKVHSKCCLIIRHEEDGIRYYTQIGTGNYNETTSKIYTDFSLMTGDQDIGRDANKYFRNMGIGNLNGSYEELIVSPVSLKSTVLELMDREIAKGAQGHLFFKLNSLTDKEIMNKIQEASAAGVSVKMLIRGICCLVPGLPGLTENVEVRSIVGRYLEHSRVYIFGTPEQGKMYIASADFMTRNTQRRAEIGCPVKDGAVRRKILEVLRILWSDNLKARRLGPDGIYRRIAVEQTESAPAPRFIEAQEEQMALAMAHRYQPAPPQRKVPAEPEKTAAQKPRSGGLRGFFARLFGRS
ncbi:MAG: polyphosphate kinase 1 [Anaerovoracaceae bacterium]|jgi:polyphosphate kinase